MGHGVREGRGRPLRTECNWATKQSTNYSVLSVQLANKGGLEEVNLKYCHCLDSDSADTY